MITNIIHLPKMGYVILTYYGERIELTYSEYLKMENYDI